MTALSDLIARLEAAKEGSRELDRTIAFEINWREFQNADKIYIENADDIPNWTTSLDAALTLVPEGWDWTLYSDGSGEIYKDVPSGMLPGAPGSTVIQFEGGTPALALCIAALKAREAAR